MGNIKNILQKWFRDIPIRQNHDKQLKTFRELLIMQPSIMILNIFCEGCDYCLNIYFTEIMLNVEFKVRMRGLEWFVHDLKINSGNIKEVCQI